jgi:hypothetical protein
MFAVVVGKLTADFGLVAIQPFSPAQTVEELQ